MTEEAVLSFDFGTLDNPMPRVVVPTTAEEAYSSEAIQLIRGNALEVLPSIETASVDLAFVDAPYFLSNGGMTCKSGKSVPVDKGAWDESPGVRRMHEFNTSWLGQIQRVLRPHGAIWASGTHHVILSIGFAMQELGFDIINQAVWEKPCPPPNLACRSWTHSSEILLWAARDGSSQYVFNYEDVKRANGGKQDVWRGIMPPGKDEKTHRRHTTQKPLALLRKILSACTYKGHCVLDPFMGSGTTGVVCKELGLRFIGIEQEERYVRLARARIESCDPS